MSSEYLFSLKLMLVLFDVSFVRFYFILVNDGVEKPRPSPFSAITVCIDKGRLIYQENYPNRLFFDQTLFKEETCF